MEQSKKIIKQIIVCFVVLLLSPIYSWGQYKSESEYRVIKLEKSAVTYQTVGFCTMLSSPLVVYGTSKIRQRKAYSEQYYEVKIYSDDTYSSVLETLRFNTFEEAYDWSNTLSSYTYYTSDKQTKTIYPFPKWVAWAAGGATLAIGGILYGVGRHNGYLWSKEKYKMELAYDMTSLSLKLSF